MGTDFRGAKGWFVGLALLSGCVSSSINSDVAHVRALTKASAMPPLPVGRVATREPDDTKQMLAQPLDVNAAVRVALLNNRELRARLRGLGVQRGDLIQASLLENPTFEAEVSPERETRVELRTEYDVMSFVLMPMHKKAAQHELDAARLDVAGDLVELGYQVRTAFFALQAAEQGFRFARGSLDALAAGRDAAAALLEAGNIPQLDASTQIAAFERARIIVARLELEVVELRETLQRLLGLHGEATQWSINPEMAPVPETADLVEELEARAIRSNVDIAATKLRLEAIARRTGIARVEGWLPRIDVDVHTLLGDPSNPSESTVRWGGGAAIDVPLFDRQQGTLRRYEAEFDSLLERYQGLAIDVRSWTREARARTVSAHRRARQYASVIVPAQNRVMEQTQLQYNAMQIGVFQLLEARRAQLDVALDYAETLRDYWTARAEVDALLAGRIVRGAPSDGNQSLASSQSQGKGH